MEKLRGSAMGAAPNVIPFQPSITDRHGAYLERWLHAGRQMGLLDGQICRGSGRGEPAGSYIAVWVRENADPAYVIATEGPAWRVKDMIRGVALGTFRTLEAALHFIRPVLPIAIIVLLAN